MASFQKIIAWLLIGLLSIEMVFRVPFSLPRAKALESESHENIVSLIVEETVFRKMSTDIDTYARRIQALLPNTRAVILTFPESVQPSLIASANEHLYFSGVPNHGNKTQKLIGTILIGHIPLPVVHKDDTYFLSLYPYTDFHEPHFYWNEQASQYEYLDIKRKDARPDIWHSVIDPNTGSLNTDTEQIRDFFARVYEFDQKKERYKNLGVDPQVFYMDTVNESRAISPGLLSVYEKISVPEQENLVYNRFTKEFAQYVSANYTSLITSRGSATVPSFFDWKKEDVSDSSTLVRTEGDISSKDIIDEYAVPFIQTINETYLGNVRRWVHNTGRYYNGYADVRVDLVPEFLTQKDILTGEILQGGNATLEKLVDAYVDTYLALDIPILLQRNVQKTLPEGGSSRHTYDFTYDNYFFGAKATNITSAKQCSLIRGSDFGGRNTTTEMNHGFNINGGERDNASIHIDTKAGITCPDKTDTYWGGNSPLDLLYIDGEFVLQGNRYDDFSRSILDLSAGKRITKQNSPLDCLRNDLILRPYTYTGSSGTSYIWPAETAGARYSCATSLRSPTPAPVSLDPTPEVQENILSALVSCDSSSGKVDLLDRKGVSLGLCEATNLSGVYKRISSLVKHTDPTQEVYQKQLESQSSPNMPVDENRYLLFLNRSGKEERINYPNLFDVVVSPSDSDERILQKIKDVLGVAQSGLVSSPVLPGDHRWTKLIQASTNTPISLENVLLGNEKVRTAIVGALRWKSLSTETKYAQIFNLALSPTTSSSNLVLPDKKDLYEISYLGGLGDAKNFVFAFSPEDTSELPQWFLDIQSVHTSSTGSNPYSSLSSSSSSSSSSRGGGIGFGFSFGGIGTSLGGWGSGTDSSGDGTSGTGSSGDGTSGNGSGGGLEDIWDELGEFSEDENTDIEKEEYEDTFTAEENEAVQPHKSELSSKTSTIQSGGSGDFPWNEKIKKWLDGVKEEKGWYEAKDVKHDFPELPQYSNDSGIDASGVSDSSVSGLASISSVSDLLSSSLGAFGSTIHLLSSSLGFSSLTTSITRDISQSDLNKNDIADFIEDNASAISLDISSSANALQSYGTAVISTTVHDGTSILNDSVTNAVLTVVRIDDLETNMSYTSSSPNWSRIQNEYFSLSGSGVFRNGQAQWTFSSRKDQRVRVAYETRIYNNDEVIIRSKKNTLLIGGNILTMVISPGDTSFASKNYVAGNAQGIDVFLDGLDTYPLTAEVTIRDYTTKKILWTYPSVGITNKKIHFDDAIAADMLHRAGRYTMTIIASGYSGIAHFSIDPHVAHHIEIGLPNILLKDTSYAFGIFFKDVWGNTVSSSDWKATIESSSNILLPPLASRSTKSASGKIPSSLTLMPLESGSTTLKLTMTRGSETLTGTFSRPVLSDAHIAIDIANRDDIEVGQEIPVNFLIQRSDGSVVEGWNLPVQIALRGGNAKLSTDTLTFSGGKATATLSTGSTTGDIIFYLPETGLGKPLNDTITIHAGLPAVLNMQAPELIYAKQNAQETIKFFVYDVYGNLTALHGYSIRVEVDDPTLVQGTITPEEISPGIYRANLISSGLSGRILLRAWLERDGVKSPMKTLEYATKTRALSVITSDEASQNAWQNITQVLLGAPFGQTPVRGYFAGSTLFSPNTKTLALSTLVDIPENPIFTITPSGNILRGTSDSSSDVGIMFESFKGGKLTLLAYDSNGAIVRIKYPSFSSKIRLSACDTCDDMHYFIPSAKGVTYENGVVSRYGQKLFSIAEIFSYPGLLYDFKEHTGDTLQFEVSYRGVNLGTSVLRWKSRAPQESGTENTDAISVELVRSAFATQLAWYGASSHDTPGLAVYSISASVRSPGGPHTYGWSLYPKNSGLGWTYENTSLLQFTTGQEWSSALQNHADYTTINIGDPLIKLPEYRVNKVTGFDHTLGSPVYFGTSDISNFSFKDANSDGKKDLVVFHTDGTVGMGISQGNGTMLDVGDLLSLHLAEKDMIRAGDFTGDGYTDIIYVDGEGILHLVDHTVSGPTEKPISFDTLPLLGKIKQIEVFDMDHDGIDDIIVLDHLGSLFVFYGNNNGAFRVQLIENVYDFVLSNEARASYFTGAIRYQGLGFTDPTSIPLSSSLETKNQQEQIHTTLFSKVTFTPQETTTQTPNTSSGGLVQTGNGGTVSITSSTQFGYNSSGQNTSSTSSSNTKNTTSSTMYFLNAPFVNPAYLSLTKQYASLESSGQLLSDSQIAVTLHLKNTSKKSLRDILVLERIADYFSLSGDTYSIVQGDTREIRKFIAHDADSKVLDLRGITLDPNETLQITYRGTLRSFSFGDFDVGYLEDADDTTSSDTIPAEQIRSIHATASTLSSIPEKDFYGHDVYGDIRFNPNSTCDGILLFWRSHNTYDRTYQKVVRDLDTDATAETKSNTSQSGSTSSSSSTSSTSTSSSSSSSVSNSLSSLTSLLSLSGLSSYTSGISSLLSMDTDDIANYGQSQLENTLSESGIGDSVESVTDAIDDAQNFDEEDVFDVADDAIDDATSDVLDATEATVNEEGLKKTTNGISRKTKDYLADMSCGFGQGGCQDTVSSNTTDNVPGNPIPRYGYENPSGLAPENCFNNVLCGFPSFASPTRCPKGHPRECKNECYYTPEKGWRYADGAGGAFDFIPSKALSGCEDTRKGPKQSTPSGGNGINDGYDQDYLEKGGELWDPKYLAPEDDSDTYEGLERKGVGEEGTKKQKTADMFIQGKGISDKRIFKGKTTTGYDVVLTCTGLNTIANASINVPGEYPVYGPDGNCTFTIKPREQCKDDGSEEDPLARDLDIGDSLPEEDNQVQDENDTQDEDSEDTSTSDKDSANDTTDENSTESSGGDSSDDTGGDNSTSSSGGLDNLGGIGNLLGGVGSLLGDDDSDTGGTTSSTSTSQKNTKKAQSNRFTYAKECLYFKPVTSYPTSLSETATAYLSHSTATSTSSLQSELTAYASVLNTIGLSDTALGVSGLSSLGGNGIGGSTGSNSRGSGSSGSGDSSGSEIGDSENSGPGEKVTNASDAVTGAGPVLILNPDTMKFDDYGEVLNKDLVSVVGFPNYIMDWYQKWMDEIMSSLTHLPDLIILFPDVSGLADPGWTEEKSQDTNTQDTSSVSEDQDRASSLNIQVTTDIQNSFQYLDSLPTVNFSPVTIRYSIPFADPQQAKAWIARNRDIVQAWEDASARDATGDIDTEEIIASIEKNIKIVETYLTLPEKLQNIYYQKEKLLYGVLENVNRAQNLMGSWLNENKENRQAWIDAYKQIQENLKDWQRLIDDFNNYEVRCAQCINERWDMKHWLHIILNPTLLPDTKINQMPRWPDIVLDFSKADFSLDIAFPIFDLEFYPVTLPNAPVPNLSVTHVQPLPEFPELPEVDFEYDYPNIELPKLPALPPPPEIPAKIFSDLEDALKKFNTLMESMCDYRESNKVPEWHAGAKIAEWFDYQRRGYVPNYDFSDYRYPYDLREWIESYIVTSEFTLEYDISDFIEQVREVFDGFDNFPKNFSNSSDSSASSNSSAQANANVPVSSGTNNGQHRLVSAKILPEVRAVLQDDINQNSDVIRDLIAWQKGTKQPEEVSYIGQKIPGSLHLAQGSGEENTLLAFLDTIQITQNLSSKLSSLPLAPIAVAPTPEAVSSPDSVQSFTASASNSGSEEGGFYVTHGTTTHRLLDYTEDLDAHVRIHTLDDDSDGDTDLFYSKDNIVYKKNNHTKSPSLRFIKDAPKMYTTDDVYEDFFGDSTHKQENLTSPGQIYPLQNHSHENIRYQLMSKSGDNHIAFQLARSVFASSPEEMYFSIDILPKETGPDQSLHTTKNVPEILDIDGLAYIQHNTIEKKLISGKKYIDADGKMQDVPADFVVKRGESWYATETTQIEATSKGITTRHTLRAGQKIIFSADSEILVKRGTLSKFSRITEKRALSIRDIHLPLLLGDTIITDTNGSVTVKFPDGTKREIHPSQHWMLAEYSIGSGVKKLSFPIEEGWYYGSYGDILDHTNDGLRFPFSTVFDTYSNIISHNTGRIPDTIPLTFGTATEIDFQKYFDSDMIANVDIHNLPDSAWRRVSATKIAFSSNAEEQEIILRITSSSGSTNEYTTTLVTTLPKLTIASVNSQGEISGKTTSKNSSYPMGIMSFIDGKTWTLVQGFTVRNDGTFIASVDPSSPKLTASFEDTSLATFERVSGIPYSAFSTPLTPSVSSGNYLGYVIKSANQERLRTEYRGKDISYRQISQMSDIQGKGIYVLGSGIRLEPATVGDKVLQGGVYITDTSYRPLMTLDASGVVRTLDENIFWTVQFENDIITFTLSKNQVELGKIIIKGEFVTSWDSK